MSSPQPGDRWYIARNKKKVGPIRLADLRRLLAAEKLKPTDMVWQEGAQHWRPLADVANVARTARAGGRSKRALFASAGLVLLTLLVWGLVVVLKDPNGAKAIEKPTPVVEIPQVQATIVEVARQPEKVVLRNGDEERKHPAPEERTDAGSMGDGQTAPKQRPGLIGSNDTKEIENPTPAVQLPRVQDTVEEVPQKTEKVASRGEMEERKHPVPEKRIDSGPIDDDQPSEKQQPGLMLQLGHSDGITCVAFSPDGKQMVVKRKASTALWDTANARKIEDFKVPWDQIPKPLSPSVTSSQRMTISPDLKHIAFLHNTGTSADPWQTTIRLSDASTGKEIHSFQVDIPNKIPTPPKLYSAGAPVSGYTSTRPEDVCFSPDGKKLLVFCAYSAGSGFDKGIGVWDVAAGKMIRTFIFQFGSNINPAESVALSPDGTQLLACGFNKEFKQDRNLGAGVGRIPGLKKNESWYVTPKDVVLWDVASGRAIRIFQGEAQHGGFMQSVGFSPDGKLVFTHWSLGRTQIFNATNGKPICVLAQSKDVPFAFSPDGKQLLAGGEQTAQLWDSASGREIRTFQGHTDSVTSGAFSPDGKQVLTGSADGTVRLWDVASGRELCRQIVFRDGSWVVATPDNYYMASKGNLHGIAFRVGKRTFTFDQFDLRFNRPDKVLESIGMAPRETIATYLNAYQKRLKKLNLTADTLSDDFHVPEIAVKADAEFSTPKKTLKLSVTARDSKYLLDRVQVDVNGVPLFGASGVPLRKRAAKTWNGEIEFELSAGNNKIDASVLNEKGAESLKETFSIACNVPAGKPNLYLVAVGISDYQDTHYRLTYADKDARDLANLYENKRGRFNDVKVLRILNRDATRENILKVRDFFRASQVDDLVVLFFAGHGLLDSKLNYYFATADIDFNDPAKRGLSYESIEELLDGIRARKKLLLMDTCHSGELDKEDIQLVQVEKQPEGEIKTRVVRGRLTRVAPKMGLKNSYQLLQEMFADLRRGTGAVVIASAGGVESALESATWKNGVFTYALLRGLKGEAKREQDGYVRASELRDFVEREVRRLTAGRQSPTARRENLDFDFAINTAQLEPFAHPQRVRSVAFSPDGKQLLTACDDKTARLWDAASGQEIRAFKGHIGPVVSVAFSPDGKQVRTGSDKVRLWDATTGKQIRAFGASQGDGMHVTFSPDGKQVLTGGNGNDGTVRLWDVASGQEIRAFRGHSRWLASAAFSPDGKQVLTGSADASARLWDAASGRQIHIFRHITKVSSVAFSPDGKQVLTCDVAGGKGVLWNEAKLWDAATGQEIRGFRGGHTDGLTAVAFSPDGKRVLTGGLDKTARLWDTATGKEIRIFRGHTGGISSVAFSPDGKQVATGSDDKTARLWDAASGKEVLGVSSIPAP